MEKKTVWDRKLTINRAPSPSRAYDREEIRMGKVRLAHNLEPKFKGISELELGTALSTETIRRALRILIEKGWVETEKSKVINKIDHRKQWSESSYRLTDSAYKEKCIEELSKVIIYRKAKDLESYRFFSAMLADGEWKSTTKLAEECGMKQENVFARLEVLQKKGLLNKKIKIEKCKINLTKDREIYANRKITYWQLKENKK